MPCMLLIQNLQRTRTSSGKMLQRFDAPTRPRAPARLPARTPPVLSKHSPHLVRTLAALPRRPCAAFTPPSPACAAFFAPRLPAPASPSRASGCRRCGRALLESHPAAAAAAAGAGIITGRADRADRAGGDGSAGGAAARGRPTAAAADWEKGGGRLSNLVCVGGAGWGRASARARVARASILSPRAAGRRTG
jgi:hypothetical protein